VATFEDTQRLVRMAHLLEEGIRGAVPLGTQLVPGSQINTLPRESGWCVRFLLIFRGRAGSPISSLALGRVNSALKTVAQRILFGPVQPPRQTTSAQPNMQQHLPVVLGSSPHRDSEAEAPWILHGAVASTAAPTKSQEPSKTRRKSSRSGAAVDRGCGSGRGANSTGVTPPSAVTPKPAPALKTAAKSAPVMKTATIRKTTPVAKTGTVLKPAPVAKTSALSASNTSRSSGTRGKGGLSRGNVSASSAAVRVQSRATPQLPPPPLPAPVVEPKKLYAVAAAMRALYALPLILEPQAELECIICFDSLAARGFRTTLLPCGHMTHRQCLADMAQRADTRITGQCPTCRTSFLPPLHLGCRVRINFPADTLEPDESQPPAGGGKGGGSMAAPNTCGVPVAGQHRQAWGHVRVQLHGKCGTLDSVDTDDPNGRGTVSLDAFCRWRRCGCCMISRCWCSITCGCDIFSCRCVRPAPVLSCVPSIHPL